MKKLARWLGYGLAGVVGLILVVALYVYVVSGMKLRAGDEMSAMSVSFDLGSDGDSAGVDLDYGRRMARAHGCLGCHADDLGGEVMFENFAFGRVVPPNLTAGAGGIGASYTDADWDRAIRHGIGSDGRALVIMPSIEFSNMGDVELAAIVAYLRGQPAVDRQLPKTRLGPLARGFIAFGFYDPPASVIDHDAKPTPVEPGVTVAYGEYLSGMCRECHGSDLAGQEFDEGDDGPGSAPDLTSAGALGEWSEEDFFRAMRTGVRPDGSVVSVVMPWKYFATLNDDELRAIWTYLRSVEPAPGVD